MSLYKQLSIFVALYTFIAFIVITMVNIYLAKNFIDDYRAVQNRNVAIYFQGNMSNERPLEVLEDIFQLFFENGNFSSMKLFDANERVIISKSKEIESKSQILHFLEEDSFFSSVKLFDSSENRSKVEFVISNGVLEEYVKEMIVVSAIIFSIISLIVFLALKIYARKLLAYLEDIKEKIAAIAQNDFIAITKRPKTEEFSDLAQSVNDLSTSMKSVFDKEKETDEKYYELLYKDSSTKLFNRKYFMSKVFNYIGKDAKEGEGVFVLFSFAGFDLAREKLGFLNLEKLLKTIAEALRGVVEEFEDTIVSRMNDSDFSILIPHKDFDVVNPYLEKSFRTIRRAFKENKLKDHNIFFSAGAIKYVHTDNIGSLFSKADFALSHAKAKLSHSLYFLEENEDMLILGKEQWKELIDRSLNDNTLVLFSQDILNGDKLYLKKLFVRLEHNEHIYPAYTFLPVLANFNLQKDIDKFVLIKFLEYISSSKEAEKLAIGISVSFIKDTLMISWFKSMFKKSEALENKEIVFESSYLSVIHNLEIYEEFIDLLSYRGFAFAIDNFSLESDDFEFLEKIKPKYIKIDAESVLIQTIAEEKVFQKLTEYLSANNIELVVKAVNREKDKNNLLKINQKIIQGKQSSEVMRVY